MKEKNNDMVGINIIQVRTLARCECGREYEIKNIFESCPDCQSLTRKIISGTDVVIQSVEIREEPEKQPKKMARR
jgi:Zn finger protein HypA/HybF involved in hydrogenase expression